MGTSRSRAYAALGALLALGAPLGLLAIRLPQRSEPLARAWLGELEQYASTYAYVTLSTALAFAVFGGVLGRQAERLQELARTDALTGLLNRRAFEERLVEEWGRTERSGGPLSLLLIDVDGLKELNDRAGHRRGDLALRSVARTIAQCARVADLCVRWGGDEFAVLASGSEPAEALRLAERIRARAGGGPEQGPTVSIGVATQWPQRADATSDRLLARADAALYRAKAQGRNRAVSAS